MSLPGLFAGSAPLLIPLLLGIGPKVRPKFLGSAYSSLTANHLRWCRGWLRFSIANAAFSSRVDGSPSVISYPHTGHSIRSKHIAFASFSCGANRQLVLIPKPYGLHFSELRKSIALAAVTRPIGKQYARKRCSVQALNRSAHGRKN